MYTTKIPQPGEPLYKTTLCNNFERGSCKYDRYCSFAHGKEELRTLPPRPQASNPTPKAAETVSAHKRYEEEFPALPSKPVIVQKMRADASEFIPSWNPMSSSFQLLDSLNPEFQPGGLLVAIQCAECVLCEE